MSRLGTDTTANLYATFSHALGLPDLRAEAEVRMRVEPGGSLGPDVEHVHTVEVYHPIYLYEEDSSQPVTETDPRLKPGGYSLLLQYAEEALEEEGYRRLSSGDLEGEPDPDRWHDEGLERETHYDLLEDADFRSVDAEREMNE